MGLNGGKTLTRVALDDPGTLNTLTGTARAINELADAGLAAMVEPFWSSRVDGKVRNDLSPDAVIKSIGVCSALGRTTAHTWLKLPVVPEMDRVMDVHHLPDPAARRRPGRQSRRRPSPAGGRRCSCPRCAAWSSAAPCSTRPMTTSPTAVDTAAAMVR